MTSSTDWHPADWRLAEKWLAAHRAEMLFHGDGHVYLTYRRHRDGLAVSLKSMGGLVEAVRRAQDAEKRDQEATR